MKQTDENQILVTDSEAYTVHTKDGLFPCYNVQTAVEDKKRICWRSAWLAYFMLRHPSALRSQGSSDQRRHGVSTRTHYNTCAIPAA